MENMGEKLINRLQRNERAAYMELYDFYFKRLHHFAVNFVTIPIQSSATTHRSNYIFDSLSGHYTDFLPTNKEVRSYS